jgi:hypothetical protein
VSKPGSDIAAITQVITRYAAAMTRKDVAEVQTLRVLDDAALLKLENELRDIQSWRVSITNQGITMANGARRAEMKALMRYEGVRMLGREVGRRPDEATFTLEKTGDHWMIVRLIVRR